MQSWIVLTAALTIVVAAPSPTGSQNSTLFLTVPERTVTVEIGSTDALAQVLPCDIDGDPAPTSFRWTKNYFGLKENSTFYYYVAGGHGLRIPAVKYHDNAEFTCTACNGFDCLSSVVTFRVFYKMKDDAMLNRTVQVGNGAVFYCRLEVEIRKVLEHKIFRGRRPAVMKRLMDFSEQKSISTSISPVEARLRIEQVTLDDMGWYTCVVTMYDEVFNEHKVYGYKSAYLEVLIESESSSNSTLIAVLVTIALILTCAALVIVARRRIKTKGKLNRRLVKKVTVTRNSEEFCVPTVQIQQTMIIENNLYSSASIEEYDYAVDWSWEVSRTGISLGKLLGEGAFGHVFLGQAVGFTNGENPTFVAVKMLKEIHSDDDVKDLVCELEVMKMVGKHPNVVELLGCCSQDGLLQVIMEYAEHGNLKDFLHNFCFDVDQCEKKVITNLELVSFATQITSGMVYLSSIKCVHRDLAARNILVSEGLVMKISDFGLARDVHHKDYYRKLTTGKMPIRWMAPESLEFRFFNSKTDVWSFGVLLWEIMTLGGQPYQFLPACGDLLEYLKLGNRLQQPECSPDEVYLIMKQCWLYNGENRPAFGEILQHLSNYSTIIQEA